MSDESKEKIADAAKEAASTAAGFSWAGVIMNFQKFLSYIKTQIPAIALAIFNYLRGEIKQKELELKQKQLELDKVKAHEEIEKANRNKSDSDIVDDAIRAGSESGNPKN